MPKARKGSKEIGDLRYERLEIDHRRKSSLPGSGLG